jgi:guanylate cyclase
VLTRLAQIGADPQDDDDTRAGKALLVLISVLILPVALLWAALYLAFGSPVGWVPLVYFAVLLAALVVFSRTPDFGHFLLVGQVAILFAPTLSMIPLGGFLDSAGVGLWGILAPLGALVFSDVRAAARWFVAWVVVFLGSGIAGELLGGVSPAVPEWFTSTMLALNITVGGTIVFTLLAVFAAQRRNALAALRVEQARAESLLLNILPQSIADKLKAEPQTIADQFSSASILFADVVDFTPLSERLPPAEVVGVLDHVFSHFDVLADRHGLEKIKTIGDCYMVAAGVPSPRTDHARALALMALDMQAGEHRKPHGVPRDAGADPDHPGDEGAPRGRVRLQAEGDDPGQGQGRDGGLVPRGSPSEHRRTPSPSGAGRVSRPSGRRSAPRFLVGATTPLPPRPLRVPPARAGAKAGSSGSPEPVATSRRSPRRRVRRPARRARSTAHRDTRRQGPEARDRLLGGGSTRRRWGVAVRRPRAPRARETRARRGSGSRRRRSVFVPA